MVMYLNTDTLLTIKKNVSNVHLLSDSGPWYKACHASTLTLELELESKDRFFKKYLFIYLFARTCMFATHKAAM